MCVYMHVCIYVLWLGMRISMPFPRGSFANQWTARSCYLVCTNKTWTAHFGSKHPHEHVEKLNISTCLFRTFTADFHLLIQRQSLKNHELRASDVVKMRGTIISDVCASLPWSTWGWRGRFRRVYFAVPWWLDDGPCKRVYASACTVWVYVWYVYILVCINMCHTCVCASVCRASVYVWYICMLTCVNTCHAYTCSRLRICVWLWAHFQYAYIYIYIYIYIHTYIHMYVCIYIYIYTCTYACYMYMRMNINTLIHTYVQITTYFLHRMYT